MVNINSLERDGLREAELCPRHTMKMKTKNTLIPVFTKVLKTLQDIRSGKLTIFTRPRQVYQTERKYRIIMQNQKFGNLSILFIVKQQYIVIFKCM